MFPKVGVALAVSGVAGVVGVLFVESVEIDADCEVSSDDALDEPEELPSEALSEDEPPVESTHPLDEDQSELQGS